ncbi:MAG: Mrp/NBP35 family ATP-binding protein, partial [Epsilonproteobacteria bacterium]|nr:Mrp/NBP35 family ATP-binding protein [Campylobacterota bacterium]
LAVRYDIPFLGEIPLEIDIRALSDEGRPPVAMGEERHKKYYRTIVDNLFASTPFRL